MSRWMMTSTVVRYSRDPFSDDVVTHQHSTRDAYAEKTSMVGNEVMLNPDHPLDCGPSVLLGTQAQATLLASFRWLLD